MLPSIAEVMGKPGKPPATYDDVLAAPEHKVAEIIEGELVLTPRPALAPERPAQWTSLSVFTDDAKVRAEPFAAVELDLAALWHDVQLLSGAAS
jgi:hypothetical protein